eukprot:gene9647-10410_t
MASSLSAQQIYQELVADIETLAQTQQELFNQLQIGELEHQKVNIFSDKATVEKDSQQLQRSDHETKKTTTADACTQTSFESSLKTTPSKLVDVGVDADVDVDVDAVVDVGVDADVDVDVDVGVDADVDVDVDVG